MRQLQKLILANLNYMHVINSKPIQKVFCIVGTMCRCCCCFFYISSVLSLCFALSTSYLYVQSHGIACAFLHWTSHFLLSINARKMCRCRQFTNFVQVLVQLPFNLLRFWLKLEIIFHLLVITWRKFRQFDNWSCAKKSQKVFWAAIRTFEWM